jgi:hypothetical protein
MDKINHINSDFNNNINNNNGNSNSNDDKNDKEEIDINEIIKNIKLMKKIIAKLRKLYVFDIKKLIAYYLLLDNKKDEIKCFLTQINKKMKILNEKIKDGEDDIKTLDDEILSIYEKMNNEQRWYNQNFDALKFQLSSMYE